MPFLCRVFGHRWSGLITGFRACDGAAIGRCRRCNTPIVAVDCRAAQSLRIDLDAIGARSIDELLAAGLSPAHVARSEILRRTVVYDQDMFLRPPK